MDALELLKMEQEKKRKALEEVGQGKTPKYFNRGQMEQIREKKYLEEKQMEEEKKRRKLEEKLSEIANSNRREGSVEKEEKNEGQVNEKRENDQENGEHKEKEVVKTGVEVLANSAEIVKRLRKRGEPIRLFGESDESRLMRLRKLEAMDNDGMEGQVNDFMKNFSEMDKDLDLEALQKRANQDSGMDDSKKAEQNKKPLEVIPITFELFKKNHDRTYMAIHDYFQQLLRDWEEELSKRPEEEKRSNQGKRESAIHLQSEEYLQPFFKLCREKRLPDDIMINLVSICSNMQQRNYVEANNTYYLLSIGNAPWPIGVTMVGIHERSAREKIASNQVAHVLNDEKTRKWIQSMKRLMTFCQSRYPPDDLAKTVGWIKKKD